MTTPQVKPAEDLAQLQRGSVARWPSEKVGPTGKVIVTDFELDLLTATEVTNVELLRHDIRSDTFPALGSDAHSVDVVHCRLSASTIS